MKRILFAFLVLSMLFVAFGCKEPEPTPEPSLEETLTVPVASGNDFSFSIGKWDFSNEGLEKDEGFSTSQVGKGVYTITSTEADANVLSETTESVMIEAYEDADAYAQAKEMEHETGFDISCDDEKKTITLTASSDYLSSMSQQSMTYSSLSTMVPYYIDQGMTVTTNEAKTAIMFVATQENASTKMIISKR